MNSAEFPLAPIHGSWGQRMKVRLPLPPPPVTLWKDLCLSPESLGSCEVKGPGFWSADTCVVGLILLVGDTVSVPLDLKLWLPPGVLGPLCQWTSKQGEESASGSIRSHLPW